MKCFLFATDGSEFSERAAEQAFELFQAFSDAKLIVLYVTAKERYAYDLAPEVVEGAEENKKNHIKKQIEYKFSSDLERVHFMHEVGHPSVTICRVAIENHAEMIVVGSHGKGFVDRALIGSVAHGVIHRTTIPVLIVSK